MNPSEITTFEIEAQSGQNVSNIGGDQTIYFGDRGLYTYKCYGVVDLAITYGIPVWKSAAPWFKLEIYNAHSVLHDIHGQGLQTPYTHYLSAGWAAAVGLLVVGFVVKRFARVTVGR